MKKLVSLFFIFVMLVSVLLVNNSCSEKSSNELSADLELYDGTNLNEDEIATEFFSSESSDLKCSGYNNICGEIKFFPLIASQYYYAGALIVYNDKDNLYVTYYGGWWNKFSQFQLYVGSQAGLPLGGGRNPVPGQFTFKVEGGAPTSLKTFIIPLTNILRDENGCYIIAAHAVMGPHTIWAYENSSLSFQTIYRASKWGWLVNDCIDQCQEENILGIKTWLIDTTRNFRFWATIGTQETAFSETNDWCDFMSVVKPVNNGNYNLIYVHTSDEVAGYITDIIGNVNTTFVNNKLVVKLTTNLPNAIFDDSYLFYGTQEEFDATVERCPRYDWWPNIISEQGPYHYIEIPLN